jgi:hypothetical protein
MERLTMTMARALVLVSVVIASSGAAQADDEKDKSGRLQTWTVTKDDKVIGSESLRLVVREDGKRFAAGQWQSTAGKSKAQRKTHVQQGGDGHLDKYERVEAGLKGAGLKLFEFEGKMRIAPVNAPGKPTPLGDLQVTRVWDQDLWHLYALWELPKACDGEKKLGYLDPEKKTTGQATLACRGQETVWDAGKKPVTVATWAVRGVPVEVELLVDDVGELVGVRGAERQMLRVKWGWKAGEQLGGTPGASDAGGEGGDDEKVDRGIGE